MNYLGIIIIALLVVKENRCCGPAGSPKQMCEKWNEVLTSSGFAKILTTNCNAKSGKFPQCFEFLKIFNKNDDDFISKYKYYIQFGVDLVQLQAFGTIKSEITAEPRDRHLFYLYAEASVRVSKYFYRMHNYENGINFIHDAIHKIEKNLTEDLIEPYKKHMWLAYLRESQLRLVQEIDKYKKSAKYVELLQKQSYELASSKYQALSSGSRDDPDMIFLMGKEILKTLNAHLPLSDKFSKVATSHTIEEGIEYLKKYDTMTNVSDLIESRFILGNTYMVLGDIDKARNIYVKALLTPVKNAEDRAFNYEVQQTIDRFYNLLAIPSDSPVSNNEIQMVFENIDATVSRKYKNFWNELMKPNAFGTNIIYDFIRNALIYYYKCSIESENYEPNEEILAKAKSALKKLEYIIPDHEYSKWMAMLLGAQNYSTSKSRAFLYLRMNLENALKEKNNDVDDGQLTYLHGKYLCKTALNSQRLGSFINVVGWSIPTSNNDIKKNVDLCLSIMKNENRSKFINEIERDILLATMYWHKKNHAEATRVLENTVFTKPVLNAEDRWNNFIAQDLLGFYQAQNIKNL